MKRLLVTISLISLLFSVSFTFSLAVACQPPKIISVERSPETPNYDEPVTITAKVIPKDAEVESVILKYKTYSTDWIEVTMSLEDPENCIYVAEIPAYPYNTQIIYKVYACDVHDHYSYSDYYCYVVCDFVPPVISNIQQVPGSPLPYETVTVSATVTEPPEASGVKNVTLCYITNDDWLPLEMNKQKEVWSVNILGQNEGTTVRFFVKAFDKKGNSAASSILDYTVVMPNKAPVANFTESAETVRTGEVIDFDASGSYDPDGSIVSYFWNFGDGASATGAIVSYAYVDDGSYSVTLTVTDDDGATDTASAVKTVLNHGPVASFTESEEVVHTDESISFDASGSYDPDGSVVSYSWDFGDGTTGNGVMVQHSYSQDGTYVVTLTVTDNEGAIGTASATKTIRNRSPRASFTESAETVDIGEVIHFDASGSYDPDGSIISYNWNFGDGTTGNGVMVQHAYSEEGTYTVSLTITDDDGAEDTAKATKTVLAETTVQNQNPVASFTESAETVYVGEVIDFDASGSYDPDGTITSYFWDFGDGTTETGVTVQHAYSQDGTYTVTLTVTDDGGATDTASATKTVQEQPTNQEPVALFTESAETVDIGEVIHFDASGSYDPDGSIVSYFWNFGDGASATGAIVSYAYVDDGSYSVTLTVTDDDGATDSASAIKTVLNQEPVASFTESAEIVYVNDVINFNAASSYDPDGTIVSYHWDFDDGTTGTGVSVSHSYTESGTYVVTLTVTDDDGATDIATAAKGVLIRTVQPQRPSASFTESAETVYTGENIFFDASDSSDPDGTIISYLWNFGDGNTAIGVETNHAYGDDGIYTVMLTIIDNDGATDSATSAKNVLNRPPTASFTENATMVKTGEVIQFDASHSSDSDGTIVEYFWDFGDETNATGVTPTHAYSEDGTYTVTLTVTDDDGASSSGSASKFVESEGELDSALSLSFIGAVALGLAAFTVTLLYGLLIRRRRRRRT
jgi:PKD repeat protein